jgi:hypothetical protein
MKEETIYNAISFFYHPEEKIPGTLYKVGVLEDVLEWTEEVKKTFNITLPEDTMGELLVVHAKHITLKEWEDELSKIKDITGYVGQWWTTVPKVIQNFRGYWEI